ncbi:MAG: YdeI/OmpD-associated family protein [Phocaeicola vulgatus]|nr:MAG: YdeI/OmpD-associated family protein [Phocaeicola vulgatus]
MERLGLMTDAGRAVLPDMSPNGFIIDKDILQRLQSDPVVWNNFCQFPDLYRRIRIDTIQIKRNQPELFEKPSEQIHRKYPKRTSLRRME